MHPRHVPAAAVLAALAGTAGAQATGPFPAQFEMSSLLPSAGGDGSVGFVLNGIDSYDNSGVSVSSAGDVNGDGFDDMIIGAYRATPVGRFRAGESYVVFGGAAAGAGGAIELSSLDGDNGFVLNGIDEYDQSGVSVAAAGDVNGDGADDLIIGASWADPNANFRAGESYVVFGDEALGAGGVAELSSLLPANGGDGTDGFVINGIDTFDYSGASVSSAGDVNDDGFDDLIIGARTADPNGLSAAGESYVVFGGDAPVAGGVIELSSLDGTDGFVLNGVDAFDYSGASVSAAGDVNGDGVDDLIIGALYADPNGNSAAGACYVVFGGADVGDSGVIELSSLDGDNGFVLNGADGFDFSGASVASAGDVNGDGIDDLVLGAYQAGPIGRFRAGESYVVFGEAGLGDSGTIELSSLDGDNGFVLNGVDPYDSSGASVSSAGDVNGDGIDDLIIGAVYADPNVRFSAGESYVVFGGAEVGAGGQLELSSLNGATGFVLNGINAYDQSGASVSSAGDVNGDGFDDLIVGASYADPGGDNKAGESYVVFGRCPADLNGDGILDFGDISAFIALFLAADLGADFNGDGLIDNGDVPGFIAGFLAGCA